MSIIDRLLAEVILCGNMLYTRASLYRELASGGNHRMADYFAFRGDALTPEQVAQVESYWQGVARSEWDHREEQAHG